MSEMHRLKPGQPVRLGDFPTQADAFHRHRKQAEEEFEQLREELIDLQYRFYADGRHKLLVVLQAPDAGGKDGTIRHVFRGVNPQGVCVTSFKAPTADELAHDFLWRIHNAVPARGMIGIFNRSQYEDVLITRVDRLVPEGDWRARYDQINQFEKMLAETGTVILKFFLHISRGEQQARLKKRIANPRKRWKFSHEDIAKHHQWDDYADAYEEMLFRCTTDWGPWHVIPADQKWYRNLAIARVLVGTLRRIDPQYPQPLEDLDAIVLE